MNWTTQIPIKGGYYWRRELNDVEEIVVVTVWSDGEVWVEGFGYEQPTKLTPTSPQYRWAGPIPTPNE